MAGPPDVPAGRRGGRALTPATAAGVRLAPAAGLLVLVLHVVSRTLPEGDLGRLLDAEAEHRLIAWLSAGAIVLAAVTAGRAAGAASGRKRTLLLALTAALAFCAIDEAFVVHERLGQELGDVVGLPGGRMELVAVGPVLLVVLGGLVWLGRRTPGPAGRALLLALAALVGAVVVEQGPGTLTNALERDGTVWPDVLRNGVEEGLEVTGWLLAAAGLAGLRGPR